MSRKTVVPVLSDGTFFADANHPGTDMVFCCLCFILDKEPVHPNSGFSTSTGMGHLKCQEYHSHEFNQYIKFIDKKEGEAEAADAATKAARSISRTGTPKKASLNQTSLAPFTTLLNRGVCLKRLYVFYRVITL